MDDTVIGLCGMAAIWLMTDGAMAIAYQKINRPVNKIVENWKENQYSFKTMYIDARNLTKRMKLKTIGPSTYLVKKSIKRRNFKALEIMLQE